MKRGDRISLDVATSTIVNESTGETFQAEPLSEYMMDIIRHGGIKPMMRAMAGKI